MTLKDFFSPPRSIAVLALAHEFGVNIRLRMYLRLLDTIDPLPLFAKHMLMEELKYVAIEFDVAPCVRRHEAGKIVFEISDGEFFKGVIKEICDAANGE